MKRILFFLLMTSSTFSQVERIEPPFWWSDMQHAEVQIMCYGKNIAENEVTASNGIRIKNIQKTENPNYLFITINTKNAVAQDFVFTFKNNDRVFTQNYSLKSRKKNSRNRKGFDSSDLVYLIMSDRFANGNPAIDNTDDTLEKTNRDLINGRHGGDIEGIIKNLDYIKAVGATAIWPTPLCEDNDEKGSYHGYGQSDVYKIDSRFGTNEDYVRLSAELHQRGMKNIMDYVTNHWGYNHWMMNDLPTREWIHQFPGGYEQTNYKMTTQFDTNASELDRKMCVDGWFVKSMPDLNQSNPLVLKYLIQNAIWWIEYADLDGLRVDTYSYCDKNGIANWTKAITDEYPNFNIVGEVWYYSNAQIAYWQKDSKIAEIQNYNSNLPSVMDFSLFETINDGVFNEDVPEWNKGIVRLYNGFANDFLYPNINNILVFAENHDTNRINDTYHQDFRKYQMAMTLIATIRGIPQIYYGSEIAMSGSKNKGDGDIRRDFPGGWKDDSNTAFTKEGRNEEQQKYFDFTSKLFNWRKSKTVLHNGKFTHYIPENNVYVYFRFNESESVMVVINNSGEKQTFKTNRFQENIKNFTSGKDILTGNFIDLKNEIGVESKSVLILELK